MSFIKLVLVALLSLSTTACAKEQKSNSIILSESNTVVLADEVGPVSVSKVAQKIRELDDSLPKNQPIYLVLDTPGGSIQSGLELISLVQGLERPVHTVTLFAASMGFQIAQNLSDRLITQNGILMSHKAKGQIGGEFNGDGASQLDKRYKLFGDMIIKMDQQTVKRTKGKQTFESYRKAYENELWLSANESVEQGYADRVITAKCDKSLSGTRTETVSFFGMEIALAFSKCPLQSGPLEVKASILTRKGLIPFQKMVEAGIPFNGTCSEDKVPQGMSCPLDTSLSVDRVEQEKAQIMQKYSPLVRRSSVKSYF